MSQIINYHNRAEDDIKVAKLLVTPVGNPTNDEGTLDIAAYHVQQAIEKELKHVLHDVYDISDETREFKTHIIDDLIDMVESQTDYVVPDKVKEIALTITNWESKSRYPNSIVSNLNEIIEAIDIYDLLKSDIIEYKETIFP